MEDSILSGQAELDEDALLALSDEELGALRRRYVRRIHAAETLARHFAGNGQEARRVIARAQAIIDRIDSAHYDF